MGKSPVILKKHLEEEQDRMFRIAWKICGNPQDAEEVLQDTALKAIKSWHTFRGDSKISTWLYRIAAHTCMSRKKKGKTKTVDPEILEEMSPEVQSDGLPAVSDWSDDPLTQTLNEELNEYLDEVIMKLPESYRIVFLMRDVEGLSGKQTAEALEISMSNVKVRLHRARMFLRKELESYVERKKGSK